MAHNGPTSTGDVWFCNHPRFDVQCKGPEEGGVWDLVPGRGFKRLVSQARQFVQDCDIQKCWSLNTKTAGEKTIILLKCSPNLDVDGE